MTPRSDPSRRWLLLSVQAPSRGEEILLVEALRRLGARSVEREGDRFVGLFPPPRDPDTLVRDAEAVIRTSTSLREPWIRWRWQSEAEWQARWTGIEPRRVGRFVIAAPDAEPELLEGDRVLRLRPGIAFGTAEHATTRACLSFLERLLAPGDRVVDIGAGSGILSIAAALTGARHVLALEMDPLACAAARENVAENEVGDRVEVRQLEVRPRNLRAAGPVDGLLANLQSEILLPLLPVVRSTLRPGGWAIVSGLLRGEEESVLRVAATSGLERGGEVMEAGWWTAWLRRGRHAR